MFAPQNASVLRRLAGRLAQIRLRRRSQYEAHYGRHHAMTKTDLQFGVTLNLSRAHLKL
jgi:hypothetical protein